MITVPAVYVNMNGVPLWKCLRCGGYYGSEEKASHVSDSAIDGEKGHECRARPKK